MCSISGCFNSKISFGEYEKLNRKLAHRGPDNSSVKRYDFKNKKLFLGHNRLSIQDLSPDANQPMENSRFVIVFNGENYNHIEIRKSLSFKEWRIHSDTETILLSPRGRRSRLFLERRNRQQSRSLHNDPIKQ